MTTTTSALAPSLDAGRTLPDSWYTDPPIYALEQSTIFRANWQYAGTTAGLDNSGDYVVVDAGPVPVLIVRDNDGQLRGFANVCVHRGSIIVHDRAGNRKSFQCGYHAWTYGLDGRLLAAPGSKNEPDFNPADINLIPVRMETWGPFLFVNPDQNRPDLHSVLGELPDLVSATGIDLSAVRARVRHTFEIRANWKIVVDNYLECYHCPTAHPAFCDVVDVRDYTVREYDLFSTQTAPARKHAGETAPEGIVTSGFYAYLWPNFTINIYPGPGNVSVNLFRPVAVDRTLAIFDYCFCDDVSDKDIDDFAAFVDQVQSEDTALCESVQIGLSAGVIGQGRLMFSQERAIRHFQHLVHKELSGSAP
jgi:choline monooxygenase